MGYIYTKSGKLAKRLYFGAVLLFEGLYYTFKNRVLADGGTFVENELPTINQDASLVLTPNAYKAGKLYSAVPNDGTGDFTVDRNSTATYIGQDGLIKTALANVPRFDWSTGEAALLVEPQRINLITYSEDFSNVYWNKSGLISENKELTTPTGLGIATLLTENTGVAQHRIIKSFSFIVNQIYTLSIYVKRQEGTRQFQLGGSSGNIARAYFNLDTIAVGTLGGTNTRAGIKKISNDWYYCSMEFLADTSSGNIFLSMTSSAAIDSETYTGNGTSSMLFWGAQLEEASTASSYIPTNGTTVTRLADNISVTTPAGVTSITETIDGVEQTPITTIPATYSLPVGNINKVTML